MCPASRNDEILMSRCIIAQTMRDSSTLDPVVGRELSLAEAARAHDAVMDPGALGKAVLIPESIRCA